MNKKKKYLIFISIVSLIFLGLVIFYLSTPGNIFDIRGQAGEEVNPYEIFEDEKLVSHWTFDQESGEGRYLVDSVSNNNAEPFGTTYYQSGIVDGARQFSGWHNYITVPENETLQDWDRIAMSFWLKPEEGKLQRQVVLNKGDFSVLYNPHRESITVEIRGEGFEQEYFTPNESVKEEEWTHIIVTARVLQPNNEVNIFVYRNGERVVFRKTNSLPKQNIFDGDLTFGQESDRYIRFWGVLDDIYLFNSLISAEKVKEMYNSIPRYECTFPDAVNSTLSEYSIKKDLNVGVYLNKCFVGSSSNQEKCKELIKKEYSGMMLAVQDQWQWSEFQRGRISSPNFDEMLNFARKNDFKLHFFHLIWSDRYSPRWIFPNPGTGDCGEWTSQELLEIMENRIKSYIEYTEDVVVAWNVVNEVFKEDGSFADFCWYRVLGEDYIDYAFRYAREATPDGLLVFNDNFGNGRMSRVEIDAVFNYIKAAKQRGVPIDAFGLQNHLYSTSGEQFSEGYLNDLEYFFDRAEEAGVKVLITEMDIYQAGNSDEEVKELYREVVARCLRRDNCISFTTWGIDDQSSWLRSSTHNLLDARPLLFDEKFNRKPAYYGVMWAIRNNRTRVCID